MSTADKDGADLIRIVITGSILAPSESALHQQMKAAEVTAIMEAARGMGKKVSAHAHGLPGIRATLSAGVHSIEHGSFGDDKTLELYRRSGAYLVPTMTAMKMLEGKVENDPSVHPLVKANVLNANARLSEVVRSAYRGGVKIVFGTDSNVGMHGQNAHEFELLKAARLSNADMIRSATVFAAELLGLSDEIGTLKAGKRADLIATQGDPLKDIGELDKVTFVMKNGRVVVQPRPVASSGD